MIVRRVLTRIIRYLFKCLSVGLLLNCFNASQHCLIDSLHYLDIQGFCGFLLFGEDWGIDSSGITIRIKVKCRRELTALNTVSLFSPLLHSVSKEAQSSFLIFHWGIASSILELFSRVFGKWSLLWRSSATFHSVQNQWRGANCQINGHVRTRSCV